MAIEDNSPSWPINTIKYKDHRSSDVYAVSIIGPIGEEVWEACIKGSDIVVQLQVGSIQYDPDEYLQNFPRVSPEGGFMTGFAENSRDIMGENEDKAINIIYEKSYNMKMDIEANFFSTQDRPGAFEFRSRTGSRYIHLTVRQVRDNQRRTNGIGREGEQVPYANPQGNFGGFQGQQPPQQQPPQQQYHQQQQQQQQQYHQHQHQHQTPPRRNLSGFQRPNFANQGPAPPPQQHQYQGPPPQPQQQQQQGPPQQQQQQGPPQQQQYRPPQQWNQAPSAPPQQQQAPSNQQPFVQPFAHQQQKSNLKSPPQQQPDPNNNNGNGFASMPPARSQSTSPPPDDESMNSTAQDPPEKPTKTAVKKTIFESAKQFLTGGDGGDDDSSRVASPPTKYYAAAATTIEDSSPSTVSHSL
jgi:hypothetical protein